MYWLCLAIASTSCCSLQLVALGGDEFPAWSQIERGKVSSLPCSPRLSPRAIQLSGFIWIRRGDGAVKQCPLRQAACRFITPALCVLQWLACLWLMPMGSLASGLWSSAPGQQGSAEIRLARSVP